MSEPTITLPGGVTVTVAQVTRIVELGQLLDDDFTWHKNECGCCVTVHRAGDNSGGYIIGADGEYDWYEA